MKAYYSFLFLGLLGLSLGQGYGGSSHGSSSGFPLVDPFSSDDYGGSSVIMLDTNEGFGLPGPGPSEEYPSRTPKPKRGAGIVQGSEIGLEVDPQGEDIQVLFEGRPVKIFCNLTAEGGENGVAPKTDIPIEWFKDGNKILEGERYKIFRENFTLVIEDAQKKDAGDYRCELNAETKLSRDHKIIFLEIRKMDKSQNVDEKQQLVIECPVDGIPEPSVMWMKNQKPMYELMANDSRISMTPNSKNITNGTLIISSAEWRDRGNYSCNITSFTYNFEKWTFLRVKDVYAALWPFIGIVIEVVILGIIIVIFEKRRAKAEFDESDTDQGNDQKNSGKDRRRK
ncbi:neuroplastin-like isoform X2 [Macrobrachium nipponense]|uniref:neuroplastin-like isoform X2 n=1 Tax=Macrobrachium nipponense TaxID=159736 RepID=UPI0030C7CA91